MRRYTIISTYPAEGSKNIGDQLITQALIDTLKNVKGHDIIVDVIWRADTWNNVKNIILKSDVILFACLAIRPNLTDKVYTYLKEILNTDIPLAVISAGTALPTSSNDLTINYISNENIKDLQRLDDKAIFFTTRGYYTQQFCKDIGLVNSKFSGDIAFFNYKTTKFMSNREIKMIVISDPHYSDVFLESFDSLIEGLKIEFPNSKLVIALHGNNPTIMKYAELNNIEINEIYKDKNGGLELYSETDIHIGYRVHAHVSALKRGKYSYLLEQDGRGCDYGLTINKKISVPSYRQPKSRIYKFLRKFGLIKKNTVSLLPVKQLLAIISQDRLNGFEKFDDLYKQIDSFNNMNIDYIKQLP